MVCIGSKPIFNPTMKRLDSWFNDVDLVSRDFPLDISRSPDAGAITSGGRSPLRSIVNSANQPQFRCAWATTSLGILYHDKEWGLPVHVDVVLFEFLTLEGAQAGLSWETILRKREAYREAFAGFD